MKFNLFSKDRELSDASKQQLLYGVAVLVSIISVFSIIFMLSYYSDAPVEGAFPSTSPSSNFTQAAGQQQQMDPRVAGAQTQNQQMIQPASSSGPEIPSPKPSPSPSPSKSPSPTPTPENTPAPSPSPSPSPSSAPPQPPPTSPSGLEPKSACDGSNAKIILTWNSTSNASSYNVFKDGTKIGGDIETTSYTDTSVTVGSTYVYSIKARNSGGESGHSDSKTITPTSCTSSPTPSP